MEKIKLPPRLSAIAHLVPRGAKLADVGTDHALLPLWLLENECIVSAVATDINKLPLMRAQANAQKAGESRIRFVLCDGLEGVSPAEADAVVIAGLGGENIADILRRSPWAYKPGVTLILQPMSRTEELCHAFFELGLQLEQEKLVRDAGRVYPIFRLTFGSMKPWRLGEYFTGPFSMQEERELSASLLSEQQRRLRSAVEGLSLSGRDVKKLQYLRQALLDIEGRLEELI